MAGVGWSKPKSKAAKNHWEIACQTNECFNIATLQKRRELGFKYAPK